MRKIVSSKRDTIKCTLPSILSSSFILYFGSGFKVFRDYKSSGFYPFLMSNNEIVYMTETLESQKDMP